MNGIEIIWAELKISDFSFSHEEITKTLGITPREAFNKGDLLTVGKSKRQITAEFSYWYIRTDSNLQKEATGDYEVIIEAHINNILEKIRPVKDKFLEITKDCDDWIEMIIEFYEWHSYVELSRNIIKQLSEFNLYIQFDLNYNSEGETEAEN